MRRPTGANLFPVGALSLVKNVAVLRFFCALKELEKSSTDVFQSPPGKRFVPFGLCMVSANKSIGEEQ